MDLREYLFRKRITIRAFSQLIGYHPTHISAIVNDKRIPSKRLAEAIEKASEGVVTAEELLKEKSE